MQIINAYLFSFAAVEYDLTSGSGAVLTIPAGASYMSVWMYGPGGDGEQDGGGTGQGGGGGGFLRAVNIPVAPADWGVDLTYTVGTGDPTPTTLDGAIAAGTINFDANAGTDGSGSGAGGTASGNGWASGGAVTAETGETGSTGFGSGGKCGSTVAQSLEGGAGGEEGLSGELYGGGGGGSESPSSAGNGASGKIKLRFHPSPE